MTGRFPLVLLAVTVSAAGCLTDEPHTLVSSATGLSPSHTVLMPPPDSSVKGTEASARRVGEIGRQVLEANPQIGLRPVFSTIGAEQTEVFHRGPSSTVEASAPQGSQVFVSEGLIKQCRTDGQLAAVLAYEMGRLVAERESLASPSARRPDPVPPPAVPVGNDSGGAFGSPDGTRMMELAKIDHLRHHPGSPPPPPPDPLVLARGYLKRAGYPSTDLDDVMPLIEKADQSTTLERTVRP
jgi:hypothetical protein